MSPRWKPENGSEFVSDKLVVTKVIISEFAARRVMSVRQCAHRSIILATAYAVLRCGLDAKHVLRRKGCNFGKVELCW